MRLDYVKNSLPYLRKGVTDFGRRLICGKSLCARDPERRIRGHAIGQQHPLYISIDQVGVVTVRVIARTKAAVVDYALRPRIVVIAHCLWHEIHPLDVQEDHCALGKAVSRCLGNRIVRVADAAAGADQLR